MNDLSPSDNISLNYITDIIGNCFHIKGGNSGVTEDFIYNNQPSNEDEKIPIFSGATLADNSMGFVSANALPSNQKLKIYHAPAILIIRKGKAGEMVYLESGKIAINDDAYVLVLKKEWENKINLRWFSYQYQELFYNLVTSKSDNATFNKTYAEKQQISILKLSDQLNIVNRLERFEKIHAQNLKIITFLKTITDHTSITHDGRNVTDIIGNCFHIKGGNSGLTEDFIYNNQPSNEDEKIPILSSATKKANLMGYVSKNAMPVNKKLKVFKGDCILIARNGYAGTMMYMGERDAFTINDHAYVLVLKKEWENKINLRWFSYQYQELFYNLVTSKSDNATFNKTYAEKQQLIIPDKDFQDRIAGKLLKIDYLIDELGRMCEQINKLIMCEIVD